jgi:hypothetical protein
MSEEISPCKRVNAKISPLLCKAVLFKVTQPIPRLSKAGMTSRSEGWGGLFKDASTD